MRLRSGPDSALEEEADQMLRTDRATRRGVQLGQEILSPYMYAARIAHEVYTDDGAPDESTLKGMYKRARNNSVDRLNSRDGVTRPRRS